MADDPSSARQLPPRDDHVRAQQLTGPRDTLPSDPSAAVAHPEFPLGRRGYDRDAVDAYVARVVNLVDELDAVRSPRAAVRQALERVGEETTGILAEAHATADGLTSKSRAEAEDRVQRAREEAEERIRRATAEAERLVREARLRVEELDRDADTVWQERARLLGDVQRIRGELERVVAGAEERYPPEAEPVPEVERAAEEVAGVVRAEPDERDATTITTAELPDAADPGSAAAAGYVGGRAGVTEEIPASALPDAAALDATQEISASDLREDDGLGATREIPAADLPDAATAHRGD